LRISGIFTGQKPSVSCRLLRSSSTWSAQGSTSVKPSFLSALSWHSASAQRSQSMPVRNCSRARAQMASQCCVAQFEGEHSSRQRDGDEARGAGRIVQGWGVARVARRCVRRDAGSCRSALSGSPPLTKQPFACGTAAWFSTSVEWLDRFTEASNGTRPVTASSLHHRPVIDEQERGDTTRSSAIADP